MKLITDVAIIGGGIIGLNISRILAQKFPNINILLVEKEKSLGTHSSTRNSGVLHAGFYYSTDSLKAKFCKDGNKFMTQLCEQNKLPLKYTGKIVMPLNENQNERIEQMYQQGIINQIDLKLIDLHEAKSIEPLLNVTNPELKFLYSPSTKIGSPQKVLEFFQNDIKNYKNVKVLTEHGFRNIINQSQQNTIFDCFNGQQIETKYVINCAGLYADKIAKKFGYCQDYTILPFKGLYLIDKEYKTKIKEKQLNTLIYPVPPKGNYVLGVHLTMTSDNDLKIGPTATPVFWRENYQGFDNFKIDEFQEITKEILKNVFSKQIGFYFSQGFSELKKYYRPNILKDANKLSYLFDQKNLLGYPKLGDKIVYGNAGIRAQLVNVKTRQLQADFVIEGDSNSIHILNVVSPGWTCSGPFSQYIVDKYIKQF